MSCSPELGDSTVISLERKRHRQSSNWMLAIVIKAFQNRLLLLSFLFKKPEAWKPTGAAGALMEENNRTGLISVALNLTQRGVNSAACETFEWCRDDRKPRTATELVRKAACSSSKARREWPWNVGFHPVALRIRPKNSILRKARKLWSWACVGLRSVCDYLSWKKTLVSDHLSGQSSICLQIWANKCPKEEKTPKQPT